MRCNRCNGRLKVQQTLLQPSNNQITRRRFCPKCRIVYISTEEIVDSYELDQEQSNLFLSSIIKEGSNEQATS